MSETNIKDIKDIKEIHNINMIKPNNLDIIKKDIDIIRDKTDEIIKKYIERIIYTSTLPEDINLKIDKLFAETREKF
jgi:hypothetical protein